MENKEKMDTSFEGAARPPRSMTNVQVVVRCRPTSMEERTRGVVESVHCDSIAQEVRVSLNKQGEKVFNFDKVYAPHSTQGEIYEDVVEPLVQQTLRGYNTTVLAYGQTGTGKTHTMEGEIEDRDGMGIIPRAMQSIFRSLESKGDTESYVKASYLEIYNENLTDLLSTTSSADVPNTQQLRIVEDKSKMGRGVMVQNLEEVLVKSWEDIRKVMKMAMSKRRIAATDLNERSSRSHAVFTVTVNCKEISPEGEELLRVGKINLVDLAGSECVARSGSKDVRAREAGSINQSLLTLGRVITALVEKSPHIAYRDSKLTRLLQESLGGCSLTLMIATVAPSVQCLDETLSTLEYASRAKAIKNKPMANQKMSKRVAIKEYVEEIERLRIELQAARAKDGVYLPEEDYNQLIQSGRSTSLRVQDLEAVLEKRMAELNEIRAAHSHTSSQLKKTMSELDTERDRLACAKDEIRRKETELDEERKVGEERQAIIDAHVDVESRLHDVHDELQERLKNAKDRIQGLHEKVDRKQILERENDKLVNNLRSQVERQLVELDETVRDGKTVSFEGMVKVQEWLERFQKFVTEDSRQSHATHRDRLMTTSQQFFDRFTASSLKSLQDDSLRVTKEGATNKAGFEEAQIAFSNAERAHEDALSSARMAHSNETEALRESCVAPLIAEIERSKSSANAFSNSLLVAVGALQEATRELVQEYELKLAAMEDTMRQMVKHEKARSKAASARAQEKIALILSTLNEDSSEQLDEIMLHMTKQKQSCDQFASERSNGIDSCYEMIKESNSFWFHNEAEQKQQCIQNVHVADLRSQGAAKVAWEDVAERSEEAASYIRRGMSDSQASKARVENSTQILLTELKEREKNLGNDSMNAKSSLAEIHRAALQEESVMEERSTTLLTQSKRDLDLVRTQTDSFCMDTIQKLKSSREMVDKFHLKEDVPTGRSPSKLQNFEWTKERPQTSPHSVIIERVRRARAEREKGRGVTDIEDSLLRLPSSRKHVVSVRSRNSLGSSSGSSSSVSVDVLSERDSNILSHDSHDEYGIDAMKVTELRSVLKEKGLNVSGTKMALKQRLRRASLGESMEEDY